MLPKQHDRKRPRVSTSPSARAVRDRLAGRNYAESVEAGPLALVALVRGQPLPPLEARPGVYMLRYWQEVFLD